MTLICLPWRGDLDLYFTVQWFCFISWSLFDGWTLNFWIVSQCDTTFDLQVNLGHSDLYGPVVLPYILKIICWMSIKRLDNKLVWHNLWPWNKCRSLWPLFHGPVIYWRLFDGWTLNFWISSQCDTPFDTEINVGHCDLYFMVQWFLPYRCYIQDYKSVGHKDWHRKVYVGQRPRFHSPVIFLVSARLFDGWIS